uniref:Uncharacterized protein n=1 Tax=Eimeria tenella TaxID=5802 RepID=H9BA75_EIMTE|nr:hypothetical protein [Eimeria tenella]
MTHLKHRPIRGKRTAKAYQNHLDGMCPTVTKQEDQSPANSRQFRDSGDLQGEELPATSVKPPRQQPVLESVSMPMGLQPVAEKTAAELIAPGNLHDTPMNTVFYWENITSGHAHMIAAKEREHACAFLTSYNVCAK